MKPPRLLPEIIFLTIALTFGSIFAFLIPPFQSPDEPNHFLRAYQVSEGHFFPEKQNQRLGGTLPVSLTQVRDSFSFLKNNYDARLDKSLIFRCLNLPLNAEQRAFADFSNTAIYAPTAYLPQAAATALLRPLGASPLQMLYATRLANLLVWVLLIYFSIRLIPFLKSVLAALALLPASLVIAASANADVLTNGLCWWLVATFVAFSSPLPPSKGGDISPLTGEPREAKRSAFPPLEGGRGEENPRTRLIFLQQLLAFAVVCANKLIVWPLIFLNKWRFQSGFLGICSLAAAIGWGKFAQNQFIPYDAYNPDHRDTQTLNEDVNPARQMAFILENPLFFAKITAKSVVAALPSSAAHFVGKFGWEKNYLPSLWLALLWLTMAALLATEKNPFSIRERLLAGGVIVLYVGMFAVTMYTLWCPVEGVEVTNFQGRYFVPIAPVAALALASGWLRKFKEKIWWGAVLILIMSNLAMAMSIWERYY